MSPAHAFQGYFGREIPARIKATLTTMRYFAAEIPAPATGAGAVLEAR